MMIILSLNNMINFNQEEMDSILERLSFDFMYQSILIFALCFMSVIWCLFGQDTWHWTTCLTEIQTESYCKGRKIYVEHDIESQKTCKLISVTQLNETYSSSSLQIKTYIKHFGERCSCKRYIAWLNSEKFYAFNSSTIFGKWTRKCWRGLRWKEVRKK